MKLKIVAALILAFIPYLASAQDEKESAAARLFEQYQKLGQDFDPAVADLYCDSALIRNVRIYPTGQQRAMEIPATTYKELIRSAMPMAKARGDTSTYSDVVYSQEGTNVRITATRHSEIKNYSSPFSLLVGACAGGDLAILEESSQSRP